MRTLQHGCIVIASLLGLTFLSNAAGAELAEWQNPKLTGVNNQAPHATSVICPSPSIARSIRLVNNTERVKSPFYRSLNGQWKYHYSSNVLARLSGFWKP
ncbi:MAG TPA: hypothetical protein VHI52_00595, partial [Verrucomicrobiae bacterium]|nr:hypothetical protein [Verrucomicrobiae bacterium]